MIYKDIPGDKNRKNTFNFLSQNLLQRNLLYQIDIDSKYNYHAISSFKFSKVILIGNIRCRDKI